MAASDSAKNLQGFRARPKPIVPAIPLPYIQKRKNTLEAAKKLDAVARAAEDGATAPMSGRPAVLKSINTNGNGKARSKPAQKKNAKKDANQSKGEQVDQSKKATGKAESASVQDRRVDGVAKQG